LEYIKDIPSVTVIALNGDYAGTRNIVLDSTKACVAKMAQALDFNSADGSIEGSLRIYSGTNDLGNPVSFGNFDCKYKIPEGTFEGGPPTLSNCQFSD